MKKNVIRLLINRDLMQQIEQLLNYIAQTVEPSEMTIASNEV